MAKRDKTRKRPTKADVEREFNEAIDRLVAGNPTHPKLVESAAVGKLEISPATVALEAGRSRSLIGHANCPYQSIWARIQAIRESGTATGRRTSKGIIEDLRRQVSDLEVRLAASLDSQLEHSLARQKAERTAAKWRDAFRRVRESNDKIVTLRR